MIKAHIAQNWGADGIDVTLYSRQGDGDAFVLRFTDGFMNIERVESGITSAPSFTIPDAYARALLDALLRHYEGATDLHTVRGDLLHERGRVDGLIDVLKRIALDMAGK